MGTSIVCRMNPGVTEEAGETARTVVAALKSTPAILALVIFNIMFMGVVVYVQHTNGERWHELLQTTLKLCAVGEKQ